MSEADLEPEAVLDLPQWQKDILDERIAEEDANPEAGASWEEVKQRILASLRRSS